MAENSQLKLSQVPSAFAALGEKHNALVDLLRTMTGTGMANVVFSEGKIIINVPTVSVTGGGTIPDPLTLNTFNGTNFNGGTFSGAFVGNVTGDVSGNAGTVTNGVYTTDTGTVTNTMLAGSIANNKLTNSKVTIGSTDISLGASASSLAGLSSVSSTNFTGNLNGNASTVTNGVYTTDTGTVTNAMLAGSIANNKLANSTIQLGSTVISLGSSVSSIGGLSSVTATQFWGNVDATAVTATHLDGNITSTSITVSYELNSPRITSNSSSLNSSGLTVSNGSYSASLLFSAMTHNMAIKEIDVCSGGVAKKMLILASDPY